MQSVSYPNSYQEWRNQAIELLEKNTKPRDIYWQNNIENSLFSTFTDAPQLKLYNSEPLKIPAAFVKMAKTAACHRSNKQWHHLYSLLWRIAHGEKHALKIPTDHDVHPLNVMIKSIHRDIHKMHAFVRFRKIESSPASDREQFISWFEPEHKIVRLTDSFFRKRFTGMNWSILTPDECMHWDGKKVSFTPGVDRSHAPSSDQLDKLWRSYYKSIFNVARVKLKAMQSEMPKKYWKNLPEAELIQDLIQNSQEQVQKMLENPESPEKPEPQNAYLKKLKELPYDQTK